MTFVAVAIGGAALIGGVTSVIAGNKAANATTQAADQAAGVQKYIYDTTRSDYQPYRTVGVGALDKLAGLYGVAPSGGVTGNATTGGVTGGSDYATYLQRNPDVQSGYDALTGNASARFPTAQDYAAYHYQNYGQNEGRQLPTTGSTATNGSVAPADKYGGFETSPGYQFRVDQARQAIERSAASAGSLRSGATVKSINNQVQGIASDEYNNYVNHLASLAGVGQTATGSTAQAGASYANGASQAYQAAGAGRASAYTNTGNAINQTVGGLASAYLYNKGYGGAGGNAGGNAFASGFNSGFGG